MPDICMCSGQGCPLKDNCYRYRAKPCEIGQSYFTEAPFDGKECKHFIKYHEKPKSDTTEKTR